MLRDAALAATLDFLVEERLMALALALALAEVEVDTLEVFLGMSNRKIKNKIDE